MPDQVRTAGKRARSNDLAIRIRVGETIGITKSVLQTLGNPLNFYFWWCDNNKVLAISAADEPTSMSVPIPHFFYKTRNGSKLRNWGLMKLIQSLTGWADDSVHPLTGEYIPELKLIIFPTERQEDYEQE